MIQITKFSMEDQEVAFFKQHGLIYQNDIAQGGYGSIYQVYSDHYKRVFALKKIKSDLYHSEELDCCKIIDDTRIVNVYKSFEFNGYHYILMEFCPDDVEKLARRKAGRWNYSELLKLMHDIICCVKAVHDRKIAHCDIKPANFLIDSYGRIKICDFGLSKIVYLDATSKIYSGTKMFMPPEIVNKREHDPFVADIWSLGVTLYFIITGNYPFQAFSTNVLFEKISRGIWDESLIEDANLRKIVCRCLEMNPSRRASLDELLANPMFDGAAKNKIIASIRSTSNFPQLKVLNPNMPIHSYDVIMKPKVNLRKSVTMYQPGPQIRKAISVEVLANI